MKRITTILAVICLLLVTTACGRSNQGNSAAESDMQKETAVGQTNSSVQEGPGTDEQNKTLVAFFSRADENYGVGEIEKGNTYIIAEMIAENVDGELFHIERDTPYPAEYRACTDEAKKEQNDNARPALKEDIDISGYDTIYLGYPIWWGDLPMSVYTFLEAHDWNGKTIIPFCTHAGSGLSNTEASIAKVCEGASLLDGFAIAGTTAQNEQDKAKTAVLEWLEEIGQ